MMHSIVSITRCKADGPNTVTDLIEKLFDVVTHRKSIDGQKASDTLALEYNCSSPVIVQLFMVLASQSQDIEIFCMISYCMLTEYCPAAQVRACDS